MAINEQDFVSDFKKFVFDYSLIDADTIPTCFYDNLDEIQESTDIEEYLNKYIPADDEEQSEFYRGYASEAFRQFLEYKYDVDRDYTVRLGCLLNEADYGNFDIPKFDIDAFINEGQKFLDESIKIAKESKDGLLALYAYDPIDWPSESIAVVSGVSTISIVIRVFIDDDDPEIDEIDAIYYITNEINGNWNPYEDNFYSLHDVLSDKRDEIKDVYLETLIESIRR
jgi:hypothetical protein